MSTTPAITAPVLVSKSNDFFYEKDLGFNTCATQFHRSTGVLFFPLTLCFDMEKMSCVRVLAVSILAKIFITTVNRLTNGHISL